MKVKAAPPTIAQAAITVWLALFSLWLLAVPAAAQQCPDWRQAAVQSYSYSSDFLWTPRSHSVRAGGSINLRHCNSVPGSGYVIHRPDFSFSFSANQRQRDLEFRVRGDCDTVLLINDASGRWHFNDDADGSLHPRLRLSAAREGRYDVWVGTFGSSTCNATLTVETFGGGGGGGGFGGGGTASCPDWRQAAAQSLNYTSDELWSPRRHSVVAGGGINLRNCNSVPGAGYVIHRPDFAVNFRQNQRQRDLEFRVHGDCDTVLLVNDAGGRWHFNDDADGSLHPRLRLSAAREGRYDVWVGTYGPSTCQATLTVETFGGGGGGGGGGGMGNSGGGGGSTVPRQPYWGP